MKHLRPYTLFERVSKETKIFEAKKSLTDEYLTKMGTTREELIDIFQGIVDLGHEPKFKMVFLDKDGRSREDKLSGQETPLLLIRFQSNREGYVGGSIKFDNLNYIENLYHSLSMFMSMFKDKCNITYELDNMIELQLKCQFDTEYDESKIAVSKTEISDALESCTDLVSNEYVTAIEVGHKTISLKAKPQSSVGQRLLDQLKASKTEKYISNDEEIEKIGNEVVNKLAKVLSENIKKDIRFVKADGVPFYDAVSQLQKGTGLYLFIDNKQSQKIAKVRVTNNGASKRYGAKIKRGFLRVDQCEIELETLEII